MSVENELVLNVEYLAFEDIDVYASVRIDTGVVYYSEIQEVGCISKGMTFSVTNADIAVLYADPKPLVVVEVMYTDPVKGLTSGYGEFFKVRKAKKVL